MQLRKYLRPLIVSVALAIVIYLAIALALDWENSYRAFMSLSLAVWLLILSLTLMNFIFRGVRWHGYMLLLGHRVPLFKDLAIYLAGLAFTTTRERSARRCAPSISSNSAFPTRTVSPP